MALTPDAEEQASRNRIAASATATLFGIGLSVSDYASVGAWMTVAGVGFLVWALHRYGRLGPDST